MDSGVLKWIEAVLDHAIHQHRYLREDPVASQIWLDIVCGWANPVGSHAVKRQDIRRVLPGLLAQRGYRQTGGPHNSRVWTKAAETALPDPNHV